MTARSAQYLLDTNVFIQAKNTYYSFDICPGFWTSLKRHAQAGRVISVDRVFDELKSGHDVLSDWVEGVEECLFKKTEDKDVIAEYRRVVAWAESQKQITRKAKDDFSRSENADAWIVAYAIANGCTVVTHETFEPAVQRAVKIPNVCRAFGIVSVNTFEMLRGLNAKFTLSPKRKNDNKQ